VLHNNNATPLPEVQLEPNQPDARLKPKEAASRDQKKRTGLQQAEGFVQQAEDEKPLI
jgi:hypothetical protein